MKKRLALIEKNAFTIKAIISGQLKPEDFTRPAYSN
ncbi:3,4-dihydroxy-2-butanone-4-phosphate synthase [Iodobacter ciconiae]|nr:3,4-dihydroxy-2-butanone-4-phosphate synthase [Iodobacter ciconiae]